MLDVNKRLREAERALHHLELEIEQYRYHIDGLAAHPQEAERARAALEKLTTQLASQRMCCDLLAGNSTRCCTREIVASPATQPAA
jgi:hypothetical protein